MDQKEADGFLAIGDVVENVRTREIMVVEKIWPEDSGRYGGSREVEGYREGVCVRWEIEDIRFVW